MKKNLLWLLTLTSVSMVQCTELNSSSSQIAIGENQIVKIRQTTVGTIDGVRVAIGNILLEDEYTLPDGSTQIGHTAEINILGNWHTVGKGSVITIGESQWKVVEVKPRTDKLGMVELEKIELKKN